MSDFTKGKWAALGRSIYCAKNGDIDNTVLLAEVSNENFQDAHAIANFISFAPEMFRLLELVAFGNYKMTFADIVQEAIRLYDMINSKEMK